MKKKIVRPPKPGRYIRSARSVKNAQGSAIRSAPNLSAVLQPINNKIEPTANLSSSTFSAVQQGNKSRSNSNVNKYSRDKSHNRYKTGNKENFHNNHFTVYDGTHNSFNNSNIFDNAYKDSHNYYENIFENSKQKIPTFSGKTGDGENIPMRAVFYCSPRPRNNPRNQANPTFSVTIEKTPCFEKARTTEIPKLFFQKCRVCCGFCDFSNEDLDKEKKEIKFSTLKQIQVALLNSNISRYLTNDSFTSALHMIAQNVFRPLCYVALEANDYAVDLEWDHIELVYNLFISLLNHSNFQISTLQINNYIKSLFIMFRMPDKREQRSISRCLNEIIKKYADSRQYIINKCSSFLTAAQYDRSTQKSLPVFLGFYLTSISYLKPKNSHNFVLTHLFPLIMLTEFKNFHATLLSILDVFLNRDSLLVDEYIMHLLNHWPITSPDRQTLFLNAIHEIVSKFYQLITFPTARRLLDRISSAFNDYTADISQQSLFMILDDGMTNLILSKGINSYHKIYIRILDTCENHWLASTRNFAFDAMAHLKSKIPQLSSINIEEVKNHLEENERIDNNKWEIIQKMAQNEKINLEFLETPAKHTFTISPPREHVQSFRNFKNIRKLTVS
ncbi:hypothetical protein TRFO_19268 [Tritrichomonas foetus]|uniref:Phosphoprotein phosphatase n=1 Tax=Tritrichomonas foetus TaxID=1144522 RepID=A0A1J4KND0_9EUKA|nr:hypothetical protein TRFO_19268 [Tritrichomonas foetus]|eukprot:OHT11292.1 hypothetical protein TRFO_19268 [Tritrichomonas foetus]